MAKITIVDIAQKAGVSRGTVDRVINNRPNVKPEIREKVLEVIEKYEYVPNKAARLLAAKASMQERKIAILFPRSNGKHFQNEALRGIEEARKENESYGLQIVVEICESSSPTEYLEKIDKLIEQGVAGFAICAKNTLAIREKIDELSERGLPVITFNTDIPESRRICFVGQDLVRSGRIAAQIMLKCTNRNEKILIVTGNLEFDAHKRRVDGFCSRMTEAGISESHYRIIEGYLDYEITFNRVSSAIQEDREIKGIYMATESVQACADAIERADLPYKIKVVCHDVSPSTAALLKKDIVDFAIEQNMYIQGYKPIIMLRDILFAKETLDYDMEYTQINIVNSENIPF